MVNIVKIVQKRTKAHISTLKNDAKMCKSSQKLAKAFKSLQKHAKACKSVQKYEKMCKGIKNCDDLFPPFYCFEKTILIQKQCVFLFFVLLST